MKEYDRERVFIGGKPGETPVVSLEVNVFRGGLDNDAKGEVIRRFTAIVAKHLGLAAGQRCAAYVLIRETDISNWGVFGTRITLDALRNPPADAVPLY